MHPGAGDHVEAILREWRLACPAIDPRPIGITGRLTRIALYAERRTQEELLRHQLTPSAFDALLTLRVASSQQASPGELARSLRMSSAGVTGLVDQLLAGGLVRRSPDGHDRRRVLVALTRRGSAKLSAASAGSRRSQDQLVRALGARPMREIDELLGLILATVDASAGYSGDGTVRRIARLAHHINGDADTLFSRFGITHGGFQVLASLYRAGPPFRHSPRRLALGLMLSGAGLSGRMDQLERQGLLNRHRDQDDRRAVSVELSRGGRRVVRAAFPEFVRSHARLLDGALQASEQDELIALLRLVLFHLESSARTELTRD